MLVRNDNLYTGVYKDVGCSWHPVFDRPREAQDWTLLFSFLRSLPLVLIPWALLGLVPCLPALFGLKEYCQKHRSCHHEAWTKQAMVWFARRMVDLLGYCRLRYRYDAIWL